MPAGLSFVTVTLPYTTGIPEDVTINTFALFGDATPDAAAMDLVTADLERFYDEPAGGILYPISSMLSRALSRAADAVEVAFYDGTTLPMGSPVGVRNFTLGPITAASGAGEYPAEVAVTLSLSAQADEEPEESGLIRPAARRRGRIYLGPLNTGVGDTVNGHVRVFADFRTLVTAAADRLADELLFDGYVWSVWSRAGDDLNAISEGWVDDAFDTQRRRGHQATTRTIFTV